MQLENYYTENNGFLQFSRKQASDFAKHVAGDFNPIHDEDAKRFCVPGDLLFSVVLAREGISESMHVEFSGMISDTTQLMISHQDNGKLTIIDANGKSYLNIQREGQCRKDPMLAEHVAQNYVQFSGMNFPHIMVPLMKEANAMINPDRPLVIYESMSLSFNHLDFTNPCVELTQSEIDVDGKKGSVTLSFCFKEGDEIIGQGKKRMIMSGLRPYCQETVDELVTRFNQRKQDFAFA